MSRALRVVEDAVGDGSWAAKHDDIVRIPVSDVIEDVVRNAVAGDHIDGCVPEACECAPGESVRVVGTDRQEDDIGAGECVPVAGIAVRESARRDERSLRFFRRANGMSWLSWEMDPETAALVGELCDRATSPTSDTRLHKQLDRRRFTP